MYLEIYKIFYMILRVGGRRSVVIEFKKKGVDGFFILFLLFISYEFLD